MADCSFLKGVKALPHVCYGWPRDPTGTEWQGRGREPFPLEVPALKLKGKR